jgi:hypothetical protein
MGAAPPPPPPSRGGVRLNFLFKKQRGHNTLVMSL